MKRLSLSIVAIMLFSLISLLFPVNVMAANTSLNIAVSQTTVHPKQEFTVTLRLSNLAEIAPDGIKTLQTDINYDSTKVTLKATSITPEIQSMIDSGKVMINTGGTTADKISLMLNMNDVTMAMPKTITDIVTYTFVVNENAAAGDISFSYKTDQMTVDKAIADNLSESVFEQITIGGPTNVTIGAKLSEDCTLSSLSIEGYNLKPAFKSTTYSYTLTVPNKIKTVKIGLATTSSKATYTISDTALKVGENKIAITVTAEDGTTKKVYLITVTREAPPAESNDTTSVVSSEPDSSVVTSDPNSSTDSSDSVSYTEYEELLKSQLKQMSTEKQKLLDRQFVIIAIFSSIAVALLVALIIVSMNYKKDIR